MDAPAPLPPDVLVGLPPAVVALIQWQAEQIARLTSRIVELERKAGKNSSNSSMPPSTSHPHNKPSPSKPKSGRKRGGQPGHDKHERELIPTEQCNEVVPCVPTECRRCGKELSGVDADPIRHQVGNFRKSSRSSRSFNATDSSVRAVAPPAANCPKACPRDKQRPQLIAFTALLMACFRQSKRRAAQFLSMILNQPASAGWMVLLQNRAAEAVKPAYDELAERLAEQTVLNIDESPTKEGQAKAWVWTFVAATFTFFACRASRAADVVKGLLGEDYNGVIHCDRARMYWAFGRLQWCWAHLKRDFQALIDDPCGTKKRLGHDLMKPTNELFALWKKVRDGTISRRSFQSQMQPIRQRVDALLLRGYFNTLTYGFCKELVEHGEHLWTFLDY